MWARCTEMLTKFDYKDSYGVTERGGVRGAPNPKAPPKGAKGGKGRGAGGPPPGASLPPFIPIHNKKNKLKAS